jgi:hypothetical protein
MVIASPFFIASRPTNLVAVQADNNLTAGIDYQ